jgi:hypothetical protein
MTPPPHPTPPIPTAIQRGIRTGIAALVGFVAAFALTHWGWHVSGTEEGTAIGVLTSVATAAYNALALYLEKHFAWGKYLLLNVGGV